MLPPVSAVSTADASLLMSASRPDDAPASQTRPPVSQVEQEIANLGAGATARSLSGGVQLSQNVNVLAETLGKLMNIARMDGETAESYVNRLVTTMQALPTGDAAALEKQLGTLLRDMSLSVLADVLKNSAGPEAARIAIMLELARASTATRGGNSSAAQYWRDAIQQDGDTPLPQASASKASTSKLLLADAAVIAGTEDGPELPTSIKQLAPQVRDPAMASTQPRQAAAALSSPLVSLPSVVDDSGDTPPPPAQTRPAQGKDEIPVKDASFRTAAAITARPDALQNVPSDDEQVVIRSLRQDEQAGSRNSPPPSTAPQNAPITAATIPPGSPFAGATPKEMERLLLAVLLGKLPSEADDASLLLTHQALGEPGKDVPVKHQTMSAIATQAGLTDGSKDETSLLTSRPEMVAAQKAAMVADARTAILDQPALQSLVASLISKEGTPLPFVNYPAEKDEPESDAPPRGRWPSSEEGAEDDGNDGEGHQEQAAAEEERVAANDETIDHSVSEGANNDASIGNAEFYYLRMSGFS